MDGHIPDEGRENISSIERLVLPADLEALSVTRFDDLVAREELIYEPSTAETITDQGFALSFRFVPYLQRKPIIPADAPERKTGEGHNPFLHPSPSEVLSPVGRSHTLLVNKFSVYRPSLLLITCEFVPQKQGLDHHDLAAAWAILQHFKQKYMMIYNCGFESGSSQGHRHMQFWPYPDEQELGFELFPNKARSDDNVTSDIPNVPYKHFVLRLPKGANVHGILQAHDRLVAEVRRSHKEAGGGHDYNVILVKDWMCIIPRQHSGLDKGAGANSAAMLGLVWTVTEKERQVWDAAGPTEYLKYLGLAR